MAKRLRDMREEAGLNQEALASRLGVTQSTLSKLERGKLKLSKPLAVRLDEALQLSVEELQRELYQQPQQKRQIGIASLPVAPVQMARVVGSVGAGLWMDISDHIEIGEEVQSIGGRHAGVEQVAYKVSGNSMDLEQVFDGDYAICIPAWKGLKDGALVVIERRRGQLVERSVKQLSITATHYEFWPRSSDPRWQKPIRVPRAEGTEFVEDGDTSISIIGRMIATTRVFD